MIKKKEAILGGLDLGILRSSYFRKVASRKTSDFYEVEVPENVSFLGPRFPGLWQN